MIELLFFNIDEDLNTTSQTVFSVLSISNFLSGDSLNVVNGEYKSAIIFGLEIRLEINGYDWESEYKYMLSIRKYYLTKNTIPEIVIIHLKNIICQLISNNLHIPIAVECNNSLVMYSG